MRSVDLWLRHDCISIERLQAVYAVEAEIRGSSAEQRLAASGTNTAALMVGV